MSDSLPKEGWSSVKFEIQRAEGNLRCIAMSMHDFAQYVKIRQGVSEGFWTVLAPSIGASLHNFRYLSTKKTGVNEGAQAQKLGTPCNNKKVVSRKGHGKSPRPMGSLLEQVEEKEQELDPAPPAKKVARKKELPPAETFKYDQPLLCLPKVRLIK